ncbi:hypothetical protein [Flammeovirga sp. SubArs3]|uniref:hypothetical protein n=1 Tax=Flammeovirga sp. SubArs3 TaxID=2995316 RepID=UPI00248B2039|nr:hypothetical protein [Flammeovirga sp. SubArs3]
MKKYIALDLVLIPSKKHIEELVSINQQLLDTTLKLERTHTVPHISISMCRVEANRIDQLISKLEDYLGILDLSELSSLRIESLYQHNKNTVGWNLELNKSLTGLHYSVCALMKNYHFSEREEHQNDDFCVIHKDMPFSGVSYLNQFFVDYAYENYQPHITIGQGKLEKKHQKIGEKIIFDRVSLYHMGTGCTCEKELWSMDIDNNY